MGLVEKNADAFGAENDECISEVAESNFENDRELNPQISNPLLLNNCGC